MKTTPLYHIHCQLGATFVQKSQDWNLPSHFTDAIAEHHAVRNRVGIADISHRSRYRVNGEDRAKFLHRILSNDVEGIPVGHGNYATLLTNRGKIISDMRVYVREEAIYIDANPAPAEILFQALDKYIIADDVALEDITVQTGALAIYGPQAHHLLRAVLEEPTLPELDEYYNGFCEIVSADGAHEVMYARTHETGEIGYHLYTNVESLEALWERVMSETVPPTPIGTEALEMLRIEAGTPKYAAELTEDIIPLEAELTHAINFDKGCYIGQEIIARMHYRGHPNRLLRGIEIQRPFPVAESPQRAQQFEHRTKNVYSGEKKIGWITSIAYSPSLNKMIALGYVRMAFTEKGSSVEIEMPEGRVKGIVRLLPFYSAITN